MKKYALVLAAAGISAALVTPAEAAGSVHLKRIYYNSPGTDDGSNKSLNGEWVTITNSTSKPRSLKGWTLADDSGHIYTFKTFTLAVGATVKVRTGTGDDTQTTKYQDSHNYIWNNGRDKAILKKATGTIADTCAYATTPLGYEDC